MLGHNCASCNLIFRSDIPVRERPAYPYLLFIRRLNARFIIYTDGSSTAIPRPSSRSNSVEQVLTHLLNKAAGKTTILLFVGPHGIACNEESNACAKQAAKIIDGATRSVSFATASTLIHRTHALPLQNKRGIHQDGRKCFS